jgi:hypothetical protein
MTYYLLYFNDAVGRFCCLYSSSIDDAEFESIENEGTKRKKEQILFLITEQTYQKNR